MIILIRKAVITQPGSLFHQQKKDILIADGVIVRIADQLDEKADTIIENPRLHVSPGWVDIFTHCCDPGLEHKETLQTGAQAAASGGYTHMFVLPNTNPVIHSKSQVEYIKEKSRPLPVNIHPLGAISKNTDGNDIAEMYDMYDSGAIAFSDGLNPVQSAGILLKALQYVKAFEGVIIQIPHDKSIGTYGLMNEGIVSTRLGLPGKPIIAEEMMVARDIELAAYADSKLHFTGISTRRSVELIKNAREKGLSVSCSVTPYHLLFCDEDLIDYNTNLKVNPPLRTRENKEALVEALKEGWIDCVASHHLPQDWDNKTCEFEYAGYGMIGLETAFGIVRKQGIDLAQWISLCCINPRKIFNLPAASIAEGEPADLTLFDPDQEYYFEEKDIYSKSKNSPLIGKALKGRAIGIINGEKVFLKA